MSGVSVLFRIRCSPPSWLRKSCFKYHNVIMKGVPVSVVVPSKRSKPVRSAKAALTRFGSVLRGTGAPLRTPLMAAPLQDSSLRARRSGQRLADVPRRASRIKGNKVKRLCPGKPATDSCWFIPPAPKGDERPGGVVPVRPSPPQIRED